MKRRRAASKRAELFCSAVQDTKRQPVKFEPITCPISGAQQMSGLSRASIYRLLVAEKIQAVKSGSRTLIVMASLRDYLASLPMATFRNSNETD